MRKILSFSVVLMMAAGTLAVLPTEDEGASAPRLKLPGAHTTASLLLRSIGEAKGLDPAQLTWKDHTCADQIMTCNSTVNSTLTDHDCELDDMTFIDFWEFQGAGGQTVTIDMVSDEFDTFLFLIDPGVGIPALDDDGGEGTNSRIIHTLDVSGTWTIGANGFSPADLGNYSVTLQCSEVTEMPPAAPSNLTATPLNSSEIGIVWDDNSNNEEEFRVEIRESMVGNGGPGPFQDIGGVPANTTSVTVIGLLPVTEYDLRVHASNSAGDSAFSNLATATTLPEDGSTCTPTATNMCLNQGRFKVEIDFRDHNDDTGSALVAPPGTDDSGIFYFFDITNWEMLVKVLDSCNSPFNSFWVFAAATTDVEYTLRVTDTQTNEVKEYFNPLGTASPAITDTSAFSTCP